MKLRLDKYLSEMGYGTRSEVKRSNRKGAGSDQCFGDKKAGDEIGYRNRLCIFSRGASGVCCV